MERALCCYAFQHTAARRRLALDKWPGLAVVHRFQHTAARRRLGHYDVHNMRPKSVSTHSRPKAAGGNAVGFTAASMFQHTAARRRLASDLTSTTDETDVSTHSRPKAAGLFLIGLFLFPCCFNTQPPEGGWQYQPEQQPGDDGFNTQPPEGGWAWPSPWLKRLNNVSTHSRPKAAGR